MHRHLPVCAFAGALTLCAVALGTPAQAAPVAGLSAIPGYSAHSASMVDKAGWVRWRWHRNWWWRWRRW
ncbi:MAG: hypothetical protein K8F92_11315 [Hyphomicrobium sp.]|uniref:hypothetical protein n=1 Tax=Hyphomicrobium sp. TaxID=82 RepID=UPI0013294CD3|nr:hypothetical protein [Hyphomicrobium sp.]KAB2941578.1 MAG: hypothetical protein F9K20_09315 [Hyphomicrobium sp.]MBZ0210228.1 hypothetical protein [Hyphomicrobium sp.]MCZ7594467.1 hypothetical protein [Hyphomicrobium sp.]